MGRNCARKHRPRLRIVQRTSRDHFGGIAEELHRSLAEAVLAAKRAAGTYSEERQKRAALLQGQLKQLEQLSAELPALPPQRVKAVER